jgi:peroxiredoxin
MKAARLALVVLLAAGISVGSAILGQQWVASRARVETGPEGGPAQLDTLPDFRLPDLEGREIASADWSGKVLVLNYWATWCPPCLNEMPLLSRAQDTLGDRGVQVVGIAIDRRSDVKGFLAKHPVSYPILIGNPEAVELARQLGNLTQGLPFTAIFDRKGRRVYGRTGELASDELRVQLDRLTGTAPDTTRQEGAKPSD